MLCEVALTASIKVLFVEKIDKIMSFLRSSETEPDSSEYLKTNYITKQRITKFELTTVAAVTELVKKSQAKMCELDPMSSSLVKEYAAVLVPIITQIINKSVDEGTVSENLKNTILKPLLKKQVLVLTFGNDHPVSNVSYISKILEQVVSTQLIDLAETSCNMEPFQSCYCSGHSYETALLWVKTNILFAFDNKEITCLVLLDLSTVFDTLCHETLLNCLKFRFSLGRTILKWLWSYLAGHTQWVVIDNEDGKTSSSDNIALTRGVLQGSALGPILFSLYISPLGDICKKHKISYHGYTDDQQEYLSLKPIPGSQEQCLNQLQGCISEIQKWMKVNSLKLNDAKTEFLALGTEQQLNKIMDINIRIGEDVSEPTELIRNHGAYFDSKLTGTSHVNKLSSTIYRSIKGIARIRHLLDINTTKTLVQ